VCGFVGVRRLDGAPIDAAALEELSRLIEHRGPDGSGIWAEGAIGLAHRRLAIIDVGGSPQPMATGDDRLHLVFNGEILNYRQLRAAHPHPYRTDGDTEVLLALLDQRGIDAVAELRGQFAFAVHDMIAGDTWLARDRLGILPLYYLHTDSLFAFASEPKALYPLLPEVAVDTDVLGAYLRDRSVPAPDTLVRGIRKLPAGHVAHLGGDGALQIRRYWSPDSRTPLDVSDDEAVELVRAALDASLDDNLVADVPVGSYLSGGLDSSMVAALAARRGGAGALHTFSAGFGDARMDETPYARQVAARIGSVHHDVAVGAEDFAEEWRRLTWHRDAPLSEPADVAVHRLARAASEHVKVVLSGEGADEVFAGYPKHRMARLSQLPVPGPGRAGLDLAQRALPARFRRARIALRSLSAPTAAERMETWFAPFTPSERAALLGTAPATGPEPAPAAGSPLRRMLLADCGNWLSDNLLERGDRMTMAASVELRPPFLDHRLVELGFALPDRVKLRKGVGKWILREIARPLVPAEIIERPKSGFRVPLDAWFRTSLRDMAWDLLSSPTSFVNEVFDPAQVRQLLERHDQGRADEDIRIWTLLSLEIWHDVTVRGSWSRDQELAS